MKASSFIYFMIFNYLLFLSILVLSFSLSPEIVELQLRIASLEQKNRLLASKRLKITNPSTSIQDRHLQSYAFAEVNLISKCQFSGQLIDSYTFQTINELYFVLNLPQKNQFKVFNSECLQISQIDNIQVIQILNDRGISQTGAVYFISQDKHLYYMYEDKKFQQPVKLASLRQQSPIVGGIIRYRGKDRIQIFIVYSDGTVEVYDQSENSKIKMFLEGNNIQISLMADHHPYPLVSTKSNWISMLDTSKYVQISQNCPHIPNIKYIISQNYYGETIYIINSNKIFIVNFQLGKKLCVIKKEYDLTIEVNHLHKVSYFSNCLFMDDKVFNMTERKIYQRQECNSENSQIEFITKRNQQDKELCLKKCCLENNCTLELMEVKRPAKDKSIFIWLAASFIVVIAISLSLMKKSSISNLDIDESMIEKQRNVEKTINQFKSRSKQKSNKQKKK